MNHNHDHKGKMSVSEAGRKGGIKTSTLHGPQFYKDIGQRGGESRKRRLGHDGYVEMGRKGGVKTAATHGKDFYQSIGQKGGERLMKERGSKYYQEIGKKGGEIQKS